MGFESMRDAISQDIRKKIKEEDRTSDATDTEDAEGLKFLLHTLSQELETALETAQRVSEVAGNLGGEMERVVAGQLETYLMSTLESLITDEHQAGSIPFLVKFINEEAEQG